MEYPHRVAALLLFHVERSRVLVQPKMERRRSPLVSIPPLGRDFQGIDTTTRLSLGLVASPQSPLPFRPARSL
jgi:hypothetical protein